MRTATGINKALPCAVRPREKARGAAGGAAQTARPHQDPSPLLPGVGHIAAPIEGETHGVGPLQLPIRERHCGQKNGP